MTEAATAFQLREGAVFHETDIAPADANTIRALVPRKHEEAPINGQAVLLDGLSKSFGDRRVLSELDLAIPAGQLLAIVGRSGCGKSTLLRLIAGLERPSSGTISIGGATYNRCSRTCGSCFRTRGCFRGIAFSAMLVSRGRMAGVRPQRQHLRMSGLPIAQMIGQRSCRAARASVLPLLVHW